MVSQKWKYWFNYQFALMSLRTHIAKLFPKGWPPVAESILRVVFPALNWLCIPSQKSHKENGPERGGSDGRRCKERSRRTFWPTEVGPWSALTMVPSQLILVHSWSQLWPHRRAENDAAPRRLQTGTPGRDCPRLIWAQWHHCSEDSNLPYNPSVSFLKHLAFLTQKKLLSEIWDEMDSMGFRVSWPTHL